MKDKLRELADRLDVLSTAAAECRWREFSMRIPAEPNRDADLVMASAAVELRAYAAILDAEGDGGVVDSNALSEVIADMRGRERVGVEKYGVTVDRKDLTQAEWGKHLSEELMDALLYLKRLQDCTCPSGDGSLRWPCPVHPARSGVVSDEDVERYAAIGRAIERGAEELPEGYQLSVYVEKDAGTADMQDPDGDNVFFESDEGLAGSINAAIDAAIQGERHER